MVRCGRRSRRDGRARCAFPWSWSVILLVLGTAASFDERRLAERDDPTAAGARLLVGTGVHDATGPAAQVNLMGYAKASQTAGGIHTRLRSRAFVVAETRDDPERAVCLVSVDAGMGSDLVNARVLRRLETLLPTSLCREGNTSVSGTHTHSAPGGFLQYLLFQFTSGGFSEEATEAYVEGVARSIARAHDDLRPGHVDVAKAPLRGANINRSPSSYLLNPREERDRYADQGDTDKDMVQLNFVVEEREIGVLNWFAVHGTSLNSTNRLLSGDNKGHASYLLERHVNGKGVLPGKGEFVAAFASTNLGDVSPNTKGPVCVDTGLPCDGEASSCNGHGHRCVASGPGRDMFESAEIIGRKQFEHALKLMTAANQTRLEGPVAFRHDWIDMAHQTVVTDNGTTVRTCPAALGYSFAAGTTDGPGDFDFSQGSTRSTRFWDLVGGLVSKSSAAQRACHAPKPVLLDVGDVSKPYDWDPRTVPISVLRVGRLLVLVVPAELTTMAGRRLRSAATAVAGREGLTNPVVTIAGLSNSYAHYVTTYEEYQAQRYEAASTLHGPHTLTAYIRNFERIVTELLRGEGGSSAPKSAPLPRDLSRRQISLLPPVELDRVGGIFRKFGQVVTDAASEYEAGRDEVSVMFRSANPRNDRRTEGTFLTVERIRDDGTRSVEYVDGDWCTKYVWEGGLGKLGISFARVLWNIPSDAEAGRYRICHFGTRRSLWPRYDAVRSTLRWLRGRRLGGARAEEDADSRTTTTTSRSRYTDFQGCSKIFTVKKAA